MKFLLFYLWLPSIKVGFIPFSFSPLYTEISLMSTLANSKYPDEMPHNDAAFHKGLHCLRKQKRSSLGSITSQFK